MPITLTPGDGQDLLARFRQAREQRDPEAMLELYDEDAEYRVEPFASPLRGANAIREHWNAAAADQVHVEFDVERIWVSGHTVLTSWHEAYTRVATAERVRVRGFSTIELGEASRIERMRDWPVALVVGIDRSHERPEEPEGAGE